MLDAFFKKYAITAEVKSGKLTSAVLKIVPRDFQQVFALLAGKTFENGLYRIYPAGELSRRTKAVTAMYPKAVGKILVFAADWLGRQFALHFLEGKTSLPVVVCFEIGVAKVFTTDLPVIDFHNEALIDSADAALAFSLYKKWRRKNKSAITPTRCVGYRVPLFLGGEDKVTNLHDIDMNVYVDVCGQLWRQVRNLPDGTPIDHIKIDWRA